MTLRRHLLDCIQHAHAIEALSYALVGCRRMNKEKNELPDSIDVSNGELRWVKHNNLVVRPVRRNRLAE